MINAVIAAVGTMLVLSLSRVHVVIAIIVYHHGGRFDR